MMIFTWRRLAGTALIFVPAFFLCCLGVYIAVEGFRVRQSYATQMAVYTLVAAFFPAWKYGEEAYSFCAAAAGRLPRRARLVVAAFASWCAAVLLFVWTFEPFTLSSNIDGPGWILLAKIILFPWVLAAVVWALYRLAVRK